MAESLEAFLSRQFREVTEEGATTTRITLGVDETGKVFDTWYGPFLEQQGGPGAAALADEIEELCKGYADSFPSRPGGILMAIIAYDSSGKDRGTHHRKVHGTNKDGKASVLGGDSSMADGVRILVETMNQLLKASTSQTTALGQQNKQLMDHVQALMLVNINDKLQMMEETQARVEGGAELDPQTKYVMEQLGKIAGPMVETFGPAIIEAMSKRSTPAAPAASAIMSAAPSNGSPTKPS